MATCEVDFLLEYISLEYISVFGGLGGVLDLADLGALGLVRDVFSLLTSYRLCRPVGLAS